ncbi:hypothetical protein [Plesiomonas sp. ZOR0011]|uniref:hypothetical protein n=1 Tax=Plesiomonas sp. ZOR0011 TaxID=1339230 RepID=UPI0006482A4C|nr:hypothetical protein [Plesiomonas sp. ZOR0011]
MVKPVSKQARHTTPQVTAEEADALANRLADKPYGANERLAQDKDKTPRQEEQPEKLVRTTVCLGEELYLKLDNYSLKNKRNGNPLKNNSAVIRVALEEYFSRIENQ